MEKYPVRALAHLRRIQYHRIRFNAEYPVSGISAINPTQQEVLTALQIKKPVASRQGADL